MVDCDYFEIIEWDEETEQIYNAMCSMPSPCWPNCGSCVDRKPYIEAPGSTVCMQRWLLGKNIVLTRGDVDILDGSGCWVKTSFSLGVMLISLMVVGAGTYVLTLIWIPR